MSKPSSSVHDVVVVDTLSTHALMRAGVVQLHRWGLLDDVVAAGTPAVRTTTFRYADQEVRIAVKPSHGVDALYAPRRTVLDPILVDAAGAAGACFQFGTSITGVTRDRTGRVDGVAGRDCHGRAVRHRARWVVGADGLRSVVADAVGATVERRGTAASATVYGYWSGLATDGYQWVFRPGACAGLIPTNDGHTCVFASSSPGRIGRGGIDVLREVVRAADPDLDDRLASAGPPRGLRTFGGMPGYMRVPWGAGWALVGDAAHWKDPIGAHGLTDALRDAEILARAITAIAAGEAQESDAFDEYHNTRNRLSLPLFDLIDTIAAMRWSDAEIPELLLQLSSAMRDEAEMVVRFDDEPAVSGARL